jgi:hypothetical protein
MSVKGDRNDTKIKRNRTHTSVFVIPQDFRSLLAKNPLCFGEWHHSNIGMMPSIVVICEQSHGKAGGWFERRAREKPHGEQKDGARHTTAKVNPKAGLTYKVH